MKSRKIIFTTVLSALVCFGLCQQVQSATDTPDPGSISLSNTADGDLALAGLTTGIYNSAFGFHALLSNADANFNTGVGAGVLLVNTASENTAVGAAALFSNVDESVNPSQRHKLPVAGVRDPGHSFAVRSYSGGERFASALTAMRWSIRMVKIWIAFSSDDAWVYPGSEAMVLGKRRIMTNPRAQTWGTLEGRKFLDESA